MRLGGTGKDVHETGEEFDCIEYMSTTAQNENGLVDVPKFSGANCGTIADAYVKQGELRRIEYRA